MKAYLPRQPLATVLALVLLAATAGCEDHPAPRHPPKPWPTATRLTWQWQLTGEPDLAVDADVFELDPFATPAGAVKRLHSRDRRVICHLSAGVYEGSRPDAGRFPPDVIGTATGSPDERWLDVRQWAKLKPVLADRLRLCRGKGFDAVDVDRIDGYAHPSGFPLTFDDQLLFNRRVARLARSTGLSPGLHNDLDQVLALEPDFDFAVNEECVVHDECDRLVPFVQEDKPVFHVEYDLPTAEFCQVTLGYGFSSIRKDRSLGAWRAPCLP